MAGPGDPPVGDSSRNQVIDLPDLIQSLGQTGRSGRLRILFKGRRMDLVFRNGLIQACDSKRPAALARALVWTGQVAPGSWGKLGIPDPAKLTERELADLLVEMGVVPRDGLRDAADCHIEESFTDLLGWLGATYEFETDGAVSEWARFQIDLGTSVAPGSLLMEGVRRQDELRRVAQLVPGTWDVLEREPRKLEGLSVAQQRVFRAWRQGRPVGAIMELSGLGPWESAYATGLLVERGFFRRGNENELVVYADHARRENHHRTAEGLYRRAADVGAAMPRIFLAMGELAERRDDSQQAGRDFLAAAAAAEANDPAQAVLALRNALRLDHERETCLRRLLGIYQRLDERDDALDILFSLAQFYEGEDRIADAMRVVRQALRIGADPVRCGQVLAALALLVDDQAEAVLQLEQVITACRQAGKIDEANRGRRQLLMIEPGRCSVALEYANHLAESGDEAGRKEAVELLHRALAVDDRSSSEEVDIAIRQLLVSLDPHDVTSHQWLAKVYQKRRDREGATDQLAKLADTQERDGDRPGAIITIRRLLDLGGDQPETWRRLARLLDAEGLLTDSAQAWLAGIDGLQDSGDSDRAVAWAQEAVRAQSTNYRLRERLAEIALHAGDRGLAEDAFATSIHLAVCEGDQGRLRHCIDRYWALRPDSLWIRVEVLELARRIDFPDREAFLRDFVEFALGADNLGLAIDAAELRISCAEPPAFEARSSYVHLLREIGDGRQELVVGRQLAADLRIADQYETAADLLLELVEQHPVQLDLVREMGACCRDVGRLAAAAEHYRRAITLLQQGGDTAAALALCRELSDMVPRDPEVDRAVQLLEDGLAVNWEAIREERAQASLRRLEAEGVAIEDAGGGSTGYRNRRVSTAAE